MKAVFLKELRENARWAALLLAIIIVWTYIRLVMHETNALIQVGEVLNIMAALSGLALGIAQSVFDVRPDNWAFTVHRPVRRGALFAAKTAAGLTLLCAILLAPIFGAALRAAHPGHAAMPFHWRMILGPLMTALAGATWYFAGMLLTLRRARWYGSRVLPLGLALVASAWSTWVPSLALTLFGILLSIPLMAMAAWGAFSNAGNTTPAFAPRLGLGAAMLPGTLLLVLLISNLASEFDGVQVQRYYNIENDGRAVISQIRRDRAGSTFSVTDMNGQPLPEYATLDEGSPALHDKWVQYWTPLTDDRWIDWPGSRAWSGYRTQNSLMLSVDGGYPPRYSAPVRSWFNLTRGVIELYDNHTKHLTGTVGPNGFAPAGAEPRGRFPEKLLNITMQRRNHTLAFASVVYWLELEQQRVRPIFTATPDDPILSAGDFDPPDATQCTAILTQHRLIIVDPSGRNRIHIDVPLEFDHGRYSGVAVTKLPANDHLYAYAWWENDNEKTSPVFEFTRDGAPVRQFDQPTLPLSGANSPSLATLMGLGSPVAAVPLYRPWRLERLFHFHREMGQYWRLYLNCMIVAAILSALANAALAWWHGFGLARGIAWTLAGGLLGASGVIILLSLNDAPVRERCPGCGKLRVVDQALCSRCRAPHTPPEMDGREIFEPGDTLAVPAA